MEDMEELFRRATRKVVPRVSSIAVSEAGKIKITILYREARDPEVLDLRNERQFTFTREELARYITDAVEREENNDTAEINRIIRDSQKGD